MKYYFLFFNFLKNIYFLFYLNKKGGYVTIPSLIGRRMKRDSGEGTHLIGREVAPLVEEPKVK